MKMHRQSSGRLATFVALAAFLLTAGILGLQLIPLRAAGRPASPATVSQAVSYLRAQQDPAGSWSGATPALALRDTATALSALAATVSLADTAVVSATLWLEQARPASTDFLARRLAALAATGVVSPTLDALAGRDALLVRRTGNGFAPGPGLSTPTAVDTALALDALRRAGFDDVDTIRTPLSYVILVEQKPDGGWAFPAQGSSTVATGLVLGALAPFRAAWDIQPWLDDAIAYLAGRQQPDGGVGDAGSTPMETALALRAVGLAGGGGGGFDQGAAITYLVATQQPDGSWEDDVYVTALAVLALAQPGGGSVRGVVVREAFLAPIAGARVVYSANPDVRTTTDADGVFQLSGVPLGRISLNIGAAGYVTRTVNAEVTAGIDEDMGAIFLTPDLTLPTAAFTLPPDPIQWTNLLFPNLSTSPNGDIVRSQWDYGDGTVSTFTGKADGAHLYYDTGVYTVTLTVIDEAGLSAVTSQPISIANRPPYQVNAGADRSAPRGIPVEFQGSANDTDDDRVGLRYEWTFSDGGTYSGPTALHVFDTNGDFTATLTVTDPHGGATNDSAMVTVHDPVGPNAAFAPPAGPLFEGDPVTFTDSSADGDEGHLVRWLWDFGDGITSTLKSPYHIFAEDGTYTVNLAVADDNALTSTAALNLTVGNVPPVVALADTTVQASAVLTFTDQAADVSPADDASLSLLWDFGDGVTSTLRSASHAWAAAGTYGMTLTATDPDGGESTATALVDVIAGIPPLPSFTISPDPVVEQTQAVLTDTSTDPDGSITTREWRVNGVLSSSYNPFRWTPPDSGLYTVTLKVTDNSGLSAQITRITRAANKPPAVSLGPGGAGADWTWPRGMPIRYSGQAYDYADSSPPPFVQWEFGDGLPPAFGVSSSMLHTWHAIGAYTLTLYAMDHDGAVATATRAITVVTPVAPIPAFTYSRWTGSGDPDEGSLTRFEDTSMRPDHGWVQNGCVFDWRDGPGTDSTNPGGTLGHQFSDSGVFGVTLTAYGFNGLSATLTRPVTIANLSPLVSAGPYTATYRMGDPAWFRAEAADPSPADQPTLGYQWDFGDGQTGGPSRVYEDHALAAHVYQVAGTYTVTVAVSDKDGGAASTASPITVIANRAPRVTSTPVNLAAAGVPYSYAIQAVDPDGDPITYTLISGPAGLSLDPATAVISWTPALDQTGWHPVIVELADDEGATTRHVWTILVTEEPLGPDMVVTDVDNHGLVEDTQTLAATGVVSATVRNYGVLSVTVPFSVTFFEDRDLDNQLSPGDLTLGVTTHASGLSPGAVVNLTAPISGSVLFRDNLVFAWADSGDAVDEGTTGEANNVSGSGARSRYVPPRGAFLPRVEWAWTTSQVLANSTSVLATPMVAPLVDTNDDGLVDEQDIPAIIFMTAVADDYNTSTTNGLRAVRGDTGQELWNFVSAAGSPEGGVYWSPVAVADLDGDGRPEVVVVSFQNRLFALSNDGRLRWISDSFYFGGSSPTSSAGGATVADLDGNGVPEIVYGSAVFDNTGRLRWVGTLGAARGTGAIAGYCCFSTVADLDLDGSPEIVTGKTAYRADGSVYWNDEVNPPPGDNRDGYPAVANFDDDPYPEIAVSRLGHVYVREHDGTIKWEFYDPNVLFLGGPPTAADLDGDGRPEIAVSGRSSTVVFNRDGSVLWFRHTQDSSSAATSSAAFDFDGDGAFELVYRGELYLWVFNGRDGTVLAQIPNASCTAAEGPAVADVDDDGAAEIVVPRDLSCGYAAQVGLDTAGLWVYGDAFGNWRPARRIWHAQDYHVTNIEDDATVPLPAQNNWQVYNNFRAQIPPEGRDPFAAPDLTASRIVLDAAACPIAATLTARIGNGGAAEALAGVSVAFYNGDPASGGSLISLATTSHALVPGAYEDVSVTWDGPATGARTLYVRADDDGSNPATNQTPAGTFGQINEGDEENNLASAIFTVCDATNNPPDITSAPVESATIGNLYTYDVEATDPDADPLSYGVSPLPGLSISSDNGLITWWPTEADRGSQSIIVTVDDGRGGVATQAYTLTVARAFVVPQPLPTCTDADGDGACVPEDCDDTNPAIHPGAAEVPDNGLDDDCNAGTPDALPAPAVSLTLHSDRRAYDAGDTAWLLGRVRNEDVSATYSELLARFSVTDGGGTLVHTADMDLTPLAPGAQTDPSDAFAVGLHTPGAYDATLSLLFDGSQIAQAATTLTVNASSTLTGTLTASPTALPAGQPITLTWTVHNAGNLALDSVALSLLALNPDNGALRSSHQETVSLGLAQTIDRTTIFSTAGYNGGPTLLVLLGNTQGVTQTLASAGVTLTGACDLPWDLVVNGQVDVADVAAIANLWRQAAPPGYDFDGDGQVTVVDIQIVAAHWGQVCVR